jgi:hypothetical protein
LSTSAFADLSSKYATTATAIVSPIPRRARMSSAVARRSASIEPEVAREQLRGGLADVADAQPEQQPRQRLRLRRDDSRRRGSAPRRRRSARAT